MVPVKAVESCLIKDSLLMLVLSLLLQQPSHLTALHVSAADTPLTAYLQPSCGTACLQALTTLVCIFTGCRALITFAPPEVSGQALRSG